MIPHHYDNGSIQYYGLFNDSYPPIMDGVTLTVENYTRWLSYNKKTPCVVTPWNPLKYESDVKIHRFFSLPIASRKPYRYGYPLADPMIWMKLMRTNFALAHSHCPFSSGRLAKFVARYHNIPLIGTFHSKYRDDLLHSFTRLPWMTDLIMGRILDFFNSCDHVWIPQGKVAETVREYGYRGELTVVENGNDFADFIKGDVKEYKNQAKERRGIDKETLTLLFVGQHIREKGVFTILEALDGLRGKVRFRMDFVGNGYASEELRKATKERGLDENIIFNGMVSGRKNISDYYAAADIFLFPSPYDNAPLVVREAAAMGTPSILLKGSTAAEVINDNYNGFLIENTPREMSSLLCRLDADRGMIQETGLNARKTLVRSWENVVDEVSKRYDDIISTYKRTHRR